MPILRIVTHIAAPVEHCFDLARSIDLHSRSTEKTGERAIAGVTSGLIGEGGEVTWRAQHFGVWQTLTSRITVCDRPRHFRDVQVRGTFARLEHDHFFEPEASVGTRMTDVFDYAAPLGPLGRVAERLFLSAYLRRFLEERNAVVKAVAESPDEWRRYLAPDEGTNP